ncbi:prolyl aminopeptidase [Virgibacillus phasianinus]|uniref:Prolyl aminopeptidase n=1 Tax=Virgibacillus phasianinus TaxID=2017483 RepID=A0A220U300_9BACI|nr:alpha/beta fold hydrolase [Virgibacillus phasianinus]ASK62467.1 prolyl aminopeptidase [Virgibacillus phasianinus]
MFAKINGTRIYFDVEGREQVYDGEAWRKKPVCFILHGGPGGEHTIFQSFLTPLSKYMQLVYIDQRGCGLSDRGPTSTYTVENNVEDLEALRLYLGLEKIILFGHSYGGMLAQSYALRYPDSVSGLFLIATTPSHHFAELAQQKLEENGTEEQKKYAKLMFEGAIKTEKEMAEYWVVMDSLYSYSSRGKVKTEEEKKAIAKERSTFNWSVANAGQEFIATFDFVDQLSEITCPTLVAGGHFDWVCPVEYSVLMAEKIPDSELVIFEKSSHNIFVDEYETFNAEVSSFVQRRLGELL